jgi:sugar phosphate isomerase/epimerase
MRVHLGVKADPIENRYSYQWLFDLMRSVGVHHLQMGTTYHTYVVDDSYFRELRASAEKRGIRISSLFSSRRELVGFATGDPRLEDATRRGWERLIHVASLVGADSVGSNALVVMRDQPHLKETGVKTFFRNMKQLLPVARKAGLKALTTEPMSSVFEYPATPDDIREIAAELAPFLEDNPGSAVPLMICADISHGVADADGRVVHDNWSLFEMEIPLMWEFHFKNTDAMFKSTFGFSPEERTRGIVDLGRLKGLIHANTDRFPRREITGYLEMDGPKLGRDYSDRHLERMLVESLQALKAVFNEEEKAS